MLSDCRLTRFKGLCVTCRPLTLSELLRGWMRKSDLRAPWVVKGLRVWQGLLSASVPARACMHECVGGRGNTHSHRTWGRRGGVFLATGRGGEGRRLCLLALSLSLKPDCSDIEKSWWEVRENCSFKRVVVLGLFSLYFWKFLQI